MDKDLNQKRRKRIGDLLSSERKNRKVSQEDVARKMGVTQEQIAKLESGRRRIDIVELMDYCEQLGVDFPKIVAQIESYLNAYGLLHYRPDMKYQRGLSFVRIRVDVSWREHGFRASLGENVPGVVAFKADTFEELQEKAEERLDIHVKEMIAKGKEVDLWLRDKVYEFKYKFMDAISLLKAYSPYLTYVAISRASGISQSQLSLYANGKKKASPHQVERIAAAINKIGVELMAVVP